MCEKLVNDCDGTFFLYYKIIENHTFYIYRSVAIFCIQPFYNLLLPFVLTVVNK